MKIKPNRQELQECITNAVTMFINEKKNFNMPKDKDAARRKGNREAEMAKNGGGFKSNERTHNPKPYKDPKYKKNWADIDDDELCEAFDYDDEDDDVLNAFLKNPKNQISKKDMKAADKIGKKLDKANEKDKKQTEKDDESVAKKEFVEKPKDEEEKED